MQAGRLRHRLVVQHEEESQDTYGGVTRTWTTLDTVWGSVEPLSGKELIEAQQLDATLTHRIRIRYLANVTETCRITFDSRTFEIQTVRNFSERNREMELLCKEVRN